MNGTGSSGTLDAKAKFDASRGNTINMLAVLLVVQIALAVVLTMTHTKYKPVEFTTKLIASDLNNLQKLIIEEGGQSASSSNSSHKLVLQRAPGGWVMPDIYNFPVSPISLQNVLDKLKGLTKGLPVSTTGESPERFNVAKDKYTRAITVSDGAKETKIFLGAASTFRNAYGRIDGSNDVYAIELPVYELTVNPDAWIEKDAVATKLIDVQSADVGTFQLQKSGALWMLSANGEKHKLSDKIARNIINKLVSVRISSVLGTKDEPQYHTDKPVLVYKLKLNDGKELTYQYSQEDGRLSYVLKRSDKPFYMNADAFLVKQVKELKPDLIVNTQAEEDRREKEKDAKKVDSTAKENTPKAP